MSAASTRVVRRQLTIARLRLRVDVVRDLARDVRDGGLTDVATSLFRVADDMAQQIETLSSAD